MRTHHTIFLEFGSNQDIHQQHGEEFSKLSQKIHSSEAISKFIRETIWKEIAHADKVDSNKGGEFIVFYPASRDIYLRVAIGSNGYIATAYPTSSLDDVEWAIALLQVGINQELASLIKISYQFIKLEEGI